MCGKALSASGKVRGYASNNDRRHSLPESKECDPERRSHSAHQEAEPRGTCEIIIDKTKHYEFHRAKATMLIRLVKAN